MSPTKAMTINATTATIAMIQPVLIPELPDAGLTVGDGCGDVASGAGCADVVAGDGLGGAVEGDGVGDAAG